MANRCCLAVVRKAVSDCRSQQVASNQLSTLKKRSEFTTLRSAGRSVHISDYIVVNFKLNAHGSNRFGWTVPKYVGKAVLRNKLKRWCREFFRLNPVSTQDKYDVNIVFKRKNKQFYEDLLHEDLQDKLLQFKKRLAKQKP